MTRSTYATFSKCEDFTKVIHAILMWILHEYQGLNESDAERIWRRSGFNKHHHQQQQQQNECWLTVGNFVRGHNFSWEAFICLNMLCFQFHGTTPWGASFVSMVTRGSQQEFVSSVKPYILLCVASSHLSVILCLSFCSELGTSEGKNAARTSCHLHIISAIIKSKSQGRVMYIYIYIAVT
jgi:hypothetical protein